MLQYFYFQIDMMIYIIIIMENIGETFCMCDQQSVSSGLVESECPFIFTGYILGCCHLVGFSD